MFQDLDATLQAMLSAPAAPAELRAADVSFQTPDRSYTPTQATVNLFLHDVAENRELRDDARVTDLTNGVYTVGPPPLRVDCTYLTTAWSSKTSGLKAQEEHRLLGLALVWMSRFSVIDDTFLQGGLITPPQPYPVPVTVAQTKEGQSMGHFWTALGIAPRPAFSLTVTIGVQPSDEQLHFTAAEKFRIHSTLLQHPALAGRVLDHTLAPVQAAQVAVVGTGLTATVGPAGSFSFTGLDLGKHTLLVQVAGQADVQVPVDYEARNQIHNVILPGP